MWALDILRFLCQWEANFFNCRQLEISADCSERQICSLANAEDKIILLHFLSITSHKGSWPCEWEGTGVEILKDWILSSQPRLLLLIRFTNYWCYHGSLILVFLVAIWNLIMKKIKFILMIHNLQFLSNSIMSQKKDRNSTSLMQFLLYSFFYFKANFFQIGKAQTMPGS